MESEAQILASNAGPAAAGGVQIGAASNIEMNRESYVSVDARGAGASGELSLRAGQQILITDNAYISGEARGAGDVSGMKFQAGDLVRLDGGASITATTSGTGRAEGIAVQAPRVQIAADARIETRTAGSGSAGLITIRASDLLVDGTGGPDAGIASSSQASGSTGGIDILTGTLTLRGGGDITTIATGSGSTGPVVLRASGDVLLTDGPINSEAGLFSWAVGTGDAGSIRLSSANVTVTKEAKISTRSEQGRGGDIEIHTGSLLLQAQDAAVRRTSTEVTTYAAGGTGGLLSIEARKGVTVNGSVVAPRSFGIVSGGPDINAVPDGIFSDTYGPGTAGGIKLNAPSLSITGGGADSRGVRTQLFGTTADRDRRRRRDSDQGGPTEFERRIENRSRGRFRRARRTDRDSGRLRSN